MQYLFNLRFNLRTILQRLLDGKIDFYGEWLSTDKRAPLDVLDFPSPPHAALGAAPGVQNRRIAFELLLHGYSIVLINAHDRRIPA